MLSTQFTFEEAARLRRVLRLIWDVVAEGVTSPDDRRGYPREQVIEIVLDSNHPEIHSPKEDEELVKRFRSFPYEEQVEFARSAFQAEFYE